MADGLIVKLALDAADYTKGLKDASSAAAGAAEKIGDSFKDAAKEILSSLGAIASVDYFKELIAGAIEAGSHLNELSKQTGIAADELQGLGFAASLSGGSLDDIGQSATKLNRTLAEAAAGSKAAAEPFEKLGISLKDASGNVKTADTVILELADKFASFADGPNKAALAVALFGKAGASMIPTLDQGSKKLEESIEFSKQYSGVTRESSEAAEELEETTKKVALINSSFGNILLTTVNPQLQVLAGAYLDAKENSDLFQDSAEVLKVVLQGIVLGGTAVYTVLHDVGLTVAATTAVFNTLGEGRRSGRRGRPHQGHFPVAERRHRREPREDRQIHRRDSGREDRDDPRPQRADRLRQRHARRRLQPSERAESDAEGQHRGGGAQGGARRADRSDQGLREPATRRL